MNPDNSYAVAVFGIPEFEMELVRRIFAVSESRDNVYRLVDEAHMDAAVIALLDRTDAEATSRYEQVQSQRRDFPVVNVVNGEDHGCDYWVKRPYTVTRMLGALDRLVEDRIGGAGHREPAGQAMAARDEPAATPLANGSCKALVVDDSLPVRQQVSVALRRSGITAEFAEDGESALQLIADRNYDIVFLDVVLPGMDGYDVCKMLKKSEDKRHIPVVMLTVKSSPADRIKGEVAGCDAYLTKPVSLDEFKKTLGEVLSSPPSLDSAVAGS